VHFNIFLCLWNGRFVQLFVTNCVHWNRTVWYIVKVTVGNETVIRSVVFKWYQHIKSCEEFWEGDIVLVAYLCGGTRWRSWSRHCATSWKVAGLIPDCVIGIFHWHNPSGHTMALGSTQPLTEMSTRNISWGGKGGWCVGLTLPPSCTDCHEIWELQPPGTLWACSGLYRDCFTSTFYPFTSLVNKVTALTAWVHSDILYQGTGRRSCGK
jgi:hypothetical protein